MRNSLPIIELGDVRLRQIAQPVQTVQGDRLQQLIDDLLHTMQQKNGVGIAAPQVARSERLFIVASRPNPRYPQAPDMEPTVMINPRILSHSDDRVEGWEGCLSVPGIRGLVSRYRMIEVEYLGRDGNRYQQKLTDFVARIFQHELDHLEGITFLDRVESNRNLITDREYQKLLATEL